MEGFTVCVLAAFFDLKLALLEKLFFLILENFIAFKVGKVNISVHE